MCKFGVGTIFQESMVIQREKKLKVWGHAQSKDRIQVSVGQEFVEAYTSEDGLWETCLPPLSASADETMIIWNKNTDEKITLNHIAIGEVWIAGGQSNMEYLMKYDADRYRELRKPENSGIRFYDVPHIAFEGDDNPTGHQGIWRIANSENLPFFSAAAYYFAVDMQKKLGVPVGIVGCNWGGTTTLTWMDRERLKAHPVLKKYWESFREECGKISEKEYEERFKNCRKVFREFDLEYNDDIMYGISWPQQLEHMERLKTLPPLPMGKWDANAPGNLFESMVSRIAGFATRGVLWYQGEGDWMRAEDYADLFREVILSWREVWKEELPFLFVQIAPFYKWLGEEGREYPKVRRQQELVSKEVSGTWMTTSTDCGMKWDIHPKQKKPIGKRLALLAFGKIYGEEIACEPSECVEACVTDDKIELLFTSVGTGLTMTDDIQRGMYVCYGETRIEAEHIQCQGNKIILGNPGHGKRPEKVSFMEEAYGECMIYNSVGVPLKPFSIEIQ